jgi:hypothetical protein
MQLINWELIRNPYNWIVVYVVLAFAVFAWSLLDPLNVNAPQGSPS